ncbi:MAG: molybdopterin-dependent oxidoreductase, partial [Actinomycetota bacterium]|nr:molybdopterin-dependent oxidoreductase [Actinomycetota bacterium]
GYFGSVVAAVAADTFAEARAALDLIEVKWDVRTPLLDPEEAVARGALHGEPRRHSRGDVRAALAEADVVVEAEYRTQTLLHNALETHQAVCEWEGERLTIYVSTQFIWEVRDQVADELGIPRDKVRVVCKYMGGGFGAKNSPGDYTLIAALLARRAGRPVRCALTRREENVDAGNRNATIQRLSAGARADGTLVALRGEYISALGWDGWLSTTAGPLQMLYACDNVETVEYGAKVNTPPMDAFRAPGFVEGAWGLERLLDELAAKLEIDPLELRRQNYANADPKDERPFSAKNLMECYRRALPHWERRHAVRERSSGPWRRGVGLASQIWFGSAAPPSYASVRVESDGRATVVTAMQDIGTGTRTAMAQIAAEELGIPLECVEVELGDSSRGAYAVVSGGSSTTPTMGPAVRSAAADAKRQLLELAAHRYQLEQRALSLKDGRIVSAHGGSWPIEDVTGLFEQAQLFGKGACGPNPTGMRVLTFGVHVAEVAVDAETGEVRVERVFAVHDVGRIVNPLGASSQVEGGIIQALGHTLSEVRLDDPRSGKVLTRTLDAYKVPTIADVPEIVCEFIDAPDTHLTNLGSKGLGEPPIIPIAAAIANAIRDATGADVRSLPITREEVLEAVREAKERQRVGAAAA